MKEFNDADGVGTHSPVTTLGIDTRAERDAYGIGPLVLVFVDEEADDDDPDGEQHAQMNLTPAKARKIAVALLKAADKAEGN